ncbi:MAG: mechanosensitive ion channel family protein [Pseudomonadota bacterium]
MTATIPERVTPDMIDPMLARLTDQEIRELLRTELSRRATETEAEVPSPAPLDAVGTRLADMAATIATRVSKWAHDFSTLGDRLPVLAERLSEASHGILGMLAAAAAVIGAGIAAAGLVMVATRHIRAWLVEPQRGAYWDKVVRTGVLTVVEMLPIVAFVAATRVSAAFLLGPLGPLDAMVWIYHAGVSNAWGFLILARRAFAPDEPQIRIAPVADTVARDVFSLIHRCILIAAAGWLIAGLSPTFGFGFAPAITTVALAGVAIGLILLVAVIRNADRIKDAAAGAVNLDGETSALTRMGVVASAGLLGVYIAFATLYWLAHWLERGQQELAGPLGTLLLLLVVPIVDRMGREITASLVRKTTERAQRLRSALVGVWRILVAVFCAIIVLRLWGLNIYALSKGPDAAPFASAAFDIGVTILLGLLAWRLIKGALHTEQRIGHDAEDAEGGTGNASSRLDTLTPLFRNMLLGFTVLIVAMIILSSLGVDIGPLLASAGIVGIAVGFGAQTLVRDIFSGIFFLIDDAFRVGEYIELDAETRGEVEALSLRSLQLRHHRGPVITIPFGELRQVTNHNRDWVIYKMAFRLEPETDPQHVKKIVKAVGFALMEDPEHGPKFIEPLKSQGVASIDEDSALVIRVKFKCYPRAQFVLRREVYHRLRTAFAKAGIKFARRKVEVVSTQDAVAEAAAADGETGGVPAAA